MGCQGFGHKGGNNKGKVKGFGQGSEGGWGRAKVYMSQPEPSNNGAEGQQGGGGGGGVWVSGHKAEAGKAGYSQGKVGTRQGWGKSNNAHTKMPKAGPMEPIKGGGSTNK